MKKFFIIMIAGMLLPLNLLAQQHRVVHDWTVNEGYESNMNLTLEVRLDAVTEPGFEIGAFCGEECRGKASSQYFSQLDNHLWFLTIHGVVGDAISFFVRVNEVEQDAVTTYNLVFAPNAIIGSPSAPQVVNFVYPLAVDYMLVTDASQLVPGRHYIIANGHNGTVGTMGRQGNGKRLTSEMAFANNKANFIPAFNVLDEGTFALTLGGDETAWTLLDEVNGGYLETEGDRYDLGVEASVSDHSKWQIVVHADGTATLWNAQVQYYMAFYNGQGFYCSDNPYDLYLFTECKLISGELESLAINEAVPMYVVSSGNTLRVENLSTVNVSNLVVEDGAQLFNSSSGVMATLQKNVTAYADADVADGWYTIAAPLGAASVESSSNLLDFEYDLYEFDETNLTHEEWRNIKVQGNFTDVTPGRGYLYGNDHDVVLNFYGTLNVADVTHEVTYTDSRPDGLTGFNLLGNPYSHAIYKGQGAAIDDSRLADGYYTLSNNGAWQVKTCADPILPGMGFMVVTTEEGTVTIAKNATVPTGETNSKSTGFGRLAFSVSNGSVEDAAYLYRADGRDLPKLAHFNDVIPELSFYRDHDRVAIAHVEDNCETMTVCFDNKMAGTYTLTWDVNGWEGQSLRLVDNITGTETDLLRTSSYTFEAIGHEHPFRFKLLMKDNAEESANADFAFFQDGQLVITGTDNHSILHVMDMTGRVLATYTGPVQRIATDGMASGVYMLQLKDSASVKTQKIIVR